MSADLVLYNIGELFCPIDNDEPLKGFAMNTATIMKNAYIAVKDGKIQAVGEGEVPENLISSKTQKKRFIRTYSYTGTGRLSHSLSSRRKQRKRI